VSGVRLGPRDQLVDRTGEVVHDADEDVFLGLEVVVERGLGDVQLLGDLAERGLVVALLGEEVEGDDLDPVAGVASPVMRRCSRAHGFSPARGRRSPRRCLHPNLLDDRLVGL
jgi:hypothetical protein